MERRPWQKFEISELLLHSLAGKVKGKEGEIFSFQSDPLLASLVSCLGLQFELGNPALDRVSFLLGVDLFPGEGNPWQTEIITYHGLFGLRAWIPGRHELIPRHEGFAQILHPLSLSDAGLLNQIVIFPALVAETYQKRGIELVVVKEWVLSAFLGRETQLNYQRTNLYEIEGRIALTQMNLMENRRLAFTGTHDLADHLLGGNPAGLAAADSLLASLRRAFAPDFCSATPSRRALVLGYLIAVLLDDLAQPQWYGSAAHLRAAFSAIGQLDGPERADMDAIYLPESFHALVAGIRSRESTAAQNERRFNQFAADLQPGFLGWEQAQN